MWPIARYRHRSSSPPFYRSLDALEPYRYPYDSTTLPYAYNYGGMGGYYGLTDYAGSPNNVEMCTRQHAAAQAEMEKVKEKYDEAKKKFEDCEKKVKEAENMLRVAKYGARCGT